MSSSLWSHGGAHQAPLSMEFSRQEYWSGLPFPSPGSSLPRDRIQVSGIADRFLTIWVTREAIILDIDTWLFWDSWVRKISWRKPWKPIPVFLRENPMDRGAGWATVHRVTKSQTQLKQLNMDACVHMLVQLHILGNIISSYFIVLFICCWIDLK